MSCKIRGTILPETARYLKTLVHNDTHNEITGKLVKRQTKLRGQNITILDIDHSHMVKGDGDEVDSIDTKFNFHTHPRKAYKIYKCDLGWPSDDDYTTILNSYVYGKMLFHIISTLEGLYIVSVCYRPKKSDIPEIEKWIRSHLDIDKEGVRIPKGIMVKGFGRIYNGETYAKYANSKRWKRKKIFNVEFIDWKLITEPRIMTTFTITVCK